MSKLTDRALIESFFARLAAGEIDTWIELLTPDVTVRTPFALEGGPAEFHGTDEVRRRFGDARQRMASLAFLDIVILATEDPEQWVVTCRSEGEMRPGVPYTNTYCWLFAVREDRIRAWTEYFDPQQVEKVRPAPRPEPATGTAAQAAAPAAAPTPPIVDTALARLLDERSIVRLMADYIDRIDANDPVGAAAFFAPDGIGDFWGEHEGRAAIAERLADFLDAFSATSHHLSNVRIDFDHDPDFATAQSHVYAFHRRSGDGSSFHYWGRWVDELVRLDEGWHFASRRVVGVGDYEPGDPGRSRDFPGHPGRFDR